MPDGTIIDTSNLTPEQIKYLEDKKANRDQIRIPQNKNRLNEQQQQQPVMQQPFNPVFPPSEPAPAVGKQKKTFQPFQQQQQQTFVPQQPQQFLAPAPQHDTPDLLFTAPPPQPQQQPVMFGTPSTQLAQVDIFPAPPKEPEQPKLPEFEDYSNMITPLGSQPKPTPAQLQAMHKSQSLDNTLVDLEHLASGEPGRKVQYGKAIKI